MDLSPAERVIVGILRDEADTAFALTIAATPGGWFITMSSPTDPVVVGTGSSFDEAFKAAVGGNAEHGDDPGGEPAPAPHGLRVVAGIEHARAA